MHRNFMHLSSGLFALLLALPCIAERHVEVFYQSSKDRVADLSLPGVTVTRYDLDAPKQVTKPQITVKTPDEAKPALDAWLTTDEAAQFIENTKKAFVGYERAMKLGIERIPAIVIDDRYVVYGHTDIQEALLHYANSER